MPRIKDKALYDIYYAMIKRCYQPNNKDYKWYGGRGIQVCPDWKESATSFVKWCKENNYQQGLWLDRIDTNKDYAPQNCRWVTPQEQQRNRRNNFLVEYNGELKLLAELAEEFGIKYTTLKKRIRLGWSVEDALKKPVREFANSDK